MGRRATLIVNPRAGGGRAARDYSEALYRLRAHGISATAVSGSSAQDSCALAREAVEDGVDLIVAVGGDGTAHAVLQSVVASDAAFAVLPVGTGNDNARLLGIPRSSLQAAIDKIATAPIGHVDVGLVRTEDGSERYFLGVLSAGFDSAVNERANAMRWPHGTARYLVATLGELRAFRPADFSIEVDGQLQEGSGMLVAIGNGGSYGGGMRVCPDASARDGLLDITWVHALPRRNFVTVFPRVFRGTHVHHPAVRTLRGAQVSVRAPGALVYADGERIGHLPIRVDAVPGALRVPGCVA